MRTVDVDTRVRYGVPTPDDLVTRRVPGLGEVLVGSRGQGGSGPGGTTRLLEDVLARGVHQVCTGSPRCRYVVRAVLDGVLIEQSYVLWLRR